MLQITNSTSPKKIRDYIATLREHKGKEKEVLEIINQSLKFGHEFVINLLWEQALTYQHLVMNEDAKGDKGNKKARKENLLKMEETVNLAKYYIVRLDLYEWEHRLYRFLGRVCDYKGDFKRAISYYRRSVKSGKLDPEYKELKYPRWLEVEAFLSYSLMMSGEWWEGYTQAHNLYERFDTSQEARYLKQKDYVTWAIWKTGIPVRTINALINKKVTFDKKEASEWIIKAEKILKNPQKKKSWANFSYRLIELETIKEKLKDLAN